MWRNATRIVLLIVLASGLFCLSISQRGGTLYDVGISLITIGIVGYLYELVLRRTFLIQMIESVQSAIDEVLPPSITHVRDSGIVDVYEEIQIEKLKNRISSLEGVDIRILKIWIPEIHLLKETFHKAISERGCKVRILLLHPDSREAIDKRTSVLPRMPTDLVSDHIQHNISIIESIRDGLGDDYKQNLSLKLHKSFIAVSMYGYSDNWIVGLYLSGRAATNGMQIKVHGATSTIYQELNRHFEEEWRRAGSVDYFKMQEGFGEPGGGSGPSGGGNGGDGG